MRDVLRGIAYNYQTTECLRREGMVDWGLDYVEAFKMSYENIQEAARCAVHGVMVFK